MSVSYTRLKKEARSLFWPWCAVMAAAALPLFVDPWEFRWIGLAFLAAVTPMSFFVGVPLLAALVFGNEFHHRTLPVLLSQPVNRMQIWREKLLLMACAVVSAGAVFYWSAPSWLRPEQVVLAGLYLLFMTAGATYWTLVARSTIGALALGWLVLGAFELAGLILDIFFSGSVFWTAGRLLDGKLPEKQTATILTYVSLATVAYAGLMLWLGARKLVRFQATGGLPGGDLVLAGSRVVPDALAGWFRYRSAEPYSNLIRKELRLLQPVWLMGLLMLLYMACLGFLQLFPDPAQDAPRGQIPLRVALMVPIVALIPVMAILAGCLSLGEERTTGTHAWHMTLPVSSRRQWLIKLAAGLFSGLVCAGVLPILVFFVYSMAYGTPFKLSDAGAWLTAVGVLCLVSFWCACVVSGTVRASLWVFPVLGALIAAVGYGEMTSRQLIGLVALKFDLFADFDFTNTVANMELYGGHLAPVVVLLLLAGPALLFAVGQSGQLFRSQVRDTNLSVIRSLLPVALIAFLCSFSLGARDSFVLDAKRQIWAFLREAREAITKIQPASAEGESAYSLQLTAEDLARGSKLSDRTQRWLGNSQITVTPAKARMWYSVTIRQPGGSICTMSFRAGSGYGILSGLCE